MVIAMSKGIATDADYWATPEGERWELIDGVLYHTPETPGTWHQETSMNLSFLMRQQDGGRKLGRWLHAPFAVVLSRQNVVEPDFMYVKRERFHIMTDRACEGAPDLLVEILSPYQPADTERDRLVKPELYARHGVAEYWILSAQTETARVLTQPVIRKGMGVYTTETVYGNGDIINAAAIPGASFAVDDIFADLWPPRRR